jgi:hypothetical protein
VCRYVDELLVKMGGEWDWGVGGVTVTFAVCCVGGGAGGAVGGGGWWWLVVVVSSSYLHVAAAC